MRSSFRYFIAAFSLLTCYLVYTNLLGIQPSWKPASWPSLRPSRTTSTVNPQITIVDDTKLPDEGEVQASTTSLSSDALTFSPSSSFYTQISNSPTQTSTFSVQTPDVAPTNTTLLKPSQTPLSKIIVMAKLEKEDTSWVKEHLPE